MMMTMMTRNVSPADTNETITMPHALELVGVCHSGPIAPNRSSLWSKMTYYPPTGLILKDISFEVTLLDAIMMMILIVCLIFINRFATF